MQSPERARTRMEVYAIKVTLLGTSPPVWRRILVPRDITLGNLHRTLQTVMGWTNCHLHQFGRQRQRMIDLRSRVGTKAADENRTKSNGVWGSGFHHNNDKEYPLKLFFWAKGYHAQKESKPKLIINGRRLDGDSPSVAVANANNAFGSSKMPPAMVTAFEIPTEGCWELTAHYGGHTLTFYRIGEALDASIFPSLARLRRIDVDKSASHQLSQDAIAGRSQAMAGFYKGSLATSAETDRFRKLL